MIRALALTLFIGGCVVSPAGQSVGKAGAQPNITAPQLAPQRPGRAAEEALARATLDGLQARSIAEQREYCGYIGYDGAGQLRAMPAARGTLDGCDIPPAPADWTLAASYHTHGSYDYDYDSEVPSIDDMIGDLEEGIDGYISTPGGRFWLIDVDQQRARMLCDIGCLTRDPNFRRDPDWLPAQSYTLFELYERFDEPYDQGSSRK